MTITHADSTPVKSKKKASKQEWKAVKISLLNNQTVKLIGKSLTTSHSDPLRSSTKSVSDSGNATSVSSSPGSSDARHILAEKASSPKLPGSQKLQLVTRKVTSPIDVKPVYAKRWMVKEKFSNIGNDISVSSSHRSSEDGHILAETASSPKLPGSHKPQLVKRNVTSPIVIKPVHVKLWVVKEKFSSTNNLQRSQDLLSGLKKPCLVIESSNAEVALDKSRVPEEHEIIRIHKSIEENNGFQNSVRSDSIIYNGNDDSSGEKLCRLPNTIPKLVSPSVRSVEKASKKEREAMKVSSVNNQNDQLNVNLSSACSQLDSIESHSGINCDDGSSKEALICLQETSTEPALRLAKRKKRATKQQRKAMQISSSSMNTQNEELTGEPPKISHSDLQSSNSITLISRDANGVNLPSGQLLVSIENGCLLAETDSLPIALGSQKTKLVPDSSKEKLICLLNRITVFDPDAVSVPCSQGSKENGSLLVKSNTSPTVLDFMPKVVKPNIAKEESSCMDHVLIQKSNNLVSSLDTRCLVNGSNYAAMDTTTVLGYLQPEERESRCVQISLEENKGSRDSLGIKLHCQKIYDTPDKTAVSEYLRSEELDSRCVQNSLEENNGSRESLRTRTQIYLGDDDSLMEKLSCPETTITELDSTLVKSKENMSKHQHKAMKISLLNIQKEQLIGESSTTLHSEPLVSKSTKLASDCENDIISVSSSHGSSEGGTILAETVSSPKLLDSEKGSTYDELLKKSTPTAFGKSDCVAALKQESSNVCNSMKGNNGSHPHNKASTRTISEATMVKWEIQGYSSSHLILLVGEGDFSFSKSLARAFGSATNMVATSLNPQAYLKSVYKDAMVNVAELRLRGCKVLHGVDATYMANHSCLYGASFDRIIYNFPHCGDFSNTDTALWNNQILVSLFLENSTKMLKKDGEIHIRHKLTPFFRRWNVPGLAYGVGLELIDITPSNIRKFEGYNTKYGFERGKSGSCDDNFNCDPSCTYKFAFPRHHWELGHQNSMLNAQLYSQFAAYEFSNPLFYPYWHP